VKRVFEEIEALKATYISRDQMSRIREALLREYELDSQDNGYFLNEIARRYSEGDVAPATEFPALVAALTGTTIQQAAQTYLNTNNYVKVTLTPAK
jgi:zinc protease